MRGKENDNSYSNLLINRMQKNDNKLLQSIGIRSFGSSVTSEFHLNIELFVVFLTLSGSSIQLIMMI